MFEALHEEFHIVQRKLNHIMAAIDDLKNQADATVALIKKLSDKIAAQPIGTPDAPIVAITAELKAATDAATPPEPAPVEPPPAA